MYTILVLDDQAPIVNAMMRVIGRIPDEWLDAPCEVKGFSDPMEAMKSLDECSYDVIISDLRMPTMDGMTFLRQAQEFQPQAMRMVVSGHGDLPAVLAAVNETQVFRFIPKPWDEMELQLAVVQAMQSCKLQRENQRLADQVRMQRGLISEQEAMLRELEAECPGITRVVRDESGAICIDEFDV